LSKLKFYELDPVFSSSILTQHQSQKPDKKVPSAIVISHGSNFNLIWKEIFSNDNFSINVNTDAFTAKREDCFLSNQGAMSE